MGMEVVNVFKSADLMVREFGSFKMVFPQRSYSTGSFVDTDRRGFMEEMYRYVFFVIVSECDFRIERIYRPKIRVEMVWDKVDSCYMSPELIDVSIPFLFENDPSDGERQFHNDDIRGRVLGEYFEDIFGGNVCKVNYQHSYKDDL